MQHVLGFYCLLAIAKVTWINCLLKTLYKKSGNTTHNYFNNSLLLLTAADYLIYGKNLFLRFYAQWG